MSAAQKDETWRQDNGQKDARKLLNDVMSSYFNGHPGSELAETSREVAKILEEIEADIGSGHISDVGDVIGDSSAEAQPGTEARSKLAVVSIEEAPVQVEPSIFSDAFREVEFQSVDIDLSGKEAGSLVNEDDHVYAAIVAEALKTVPHRPVATVLGPISERPAERRLCKTDDSIAPGKVHVSDEDTCRNTAFNKYDPLPSTGSTAVSFYAHGPALSEPKSSLPADQIMLAKKHKAAIHQKKTAGAGTPDNDCLREAQVSSAEELAAGNVAFIYNRKHIDHDPSVLSVRTFEVPDRIIKAMWYLEKSHVFEDSHCTFLDDVPMASEEDILRAHEESYIRFVSNYASNGGGFLGDSTYITPRSYDIAKLSAGAAIKAGDLVSGNRYSFSFVMTRPPGHHASRSRYGGFCLFNNAAILARYLQAVKKIEKILILDWDAHAGDGTMEIFYEDPTVLTVSLHRDPHGFYPRRGYTKETGTGAGKGYSVNVEMPQGAGDEEYMFAFDEVVVPLIERFAPGFVICSCGFDAHHREKNVGLNLTSEGFHGMASRLRSAYRGGIVLLMEGGYHDFNGQLCHSVLSALQGKPNPVTDQLGLSSYKQDQQKRIFAETMTKVAEVKKVIPLLA
ncbi:histone deacetylase family protein [Methanolobus chelungpuianus]|uniref:histone deacetylase family protein n=1 Tax=Methanolobus chelungpuianus TaxID=502115 RepID=UPI002114447B|nr:histone deacetylase [Methanolobus chelungpuianus]